MIGPLGGFFMSIAATGLIYLSYFLCNLGVLLARRRGWPHKPRLVQPRSWGMLINILALVWGGAMIVNIGHLAGHRTCSATSAATAAGFTNPFIGTFFTPFGNTIETCRPWPCSRSSSA